MWQLFFTFYFLCGKYLYYGIEFCGVFRYIKVNNGKQHIMSKTNKISDSEVKEIINVLIAEIQNLRECVSCGKLVYTNKEIKELLQVNDKTLRGYRNDGLLGYTQIRDKYFYTQKDITEFLSNNHMSAYYYW